MLEEDPQPLGDSEDDLAMRSIRKERLPHPRRLGGATVLRLVAVSPRVTEAALWETITDIRAISADAQAQVLNA